MLPGEGAEASALLPHCQVPPDQVLISHSLPGLSTHGI